MSKITKNNNFARVRSTFKAAALFVVVAFGLMLTAVHGYADESSGKCAYSILDVGLPELEKEYSVPEEYDKQKLFKSTVESYNSGADLFNVNGLAFEKFAGVREDNGSAFSSEDELSGLGAEVPEFETGKLETGDILKAVPSITTKDEKTIGILVPPFAYFSKKF